MKTLRINLFTLALTLFFSGPLLAIDVGENAPCVELDGVTETGKEAYVCIREPIDQSHRFTLIDFFSTQCRTCQKNVPAVSELANDLSKSLTIRYAAIDRNVDTVKKFIASHQEQMRLPVAFDNKQRAMKVYDVLATPTLFLLEKKEGDYQVVYKHTGLLTPKEVSEIKRLVSSR